MDWVGTLGGPLIVVPAGIAHRWRGATFSTGLALLDPRTRQRENFPQIDDYTRACAIEGFLGTVKIGRGKGLVLTGERAPATFILKNEGSIIVRVAYSDLSDDHIVNLVESAPAAIWESTAFQIQVSRGGLLIFDSVFAGDDLPAKPGEGANVPWIKLRLLPGGYQIDTAIYEPTSETQLILHRLKPSEQEPK
jgi:hypothetical protein